MDNIKDSVRKHTLKLTRFAIEHAEDMYAITGPNGEYLDVNKSLCNRLGYSRDELLSMSIFDIDPLPTLYEYRYDWDKLKLSGTATLERDHVTKNGEVFPVEIKLNYFKYGDNEYNVSFTRDITKRKKDETALKESRELLNKVFISQIDAILVLEGMEEARIVDCNPAAERMFGYSRGELLGKNTNILHVNKKSMRDFQKYAYPAAKKKGFFHLANFNMKRKDGSIFPAEHTGVPLKDHQGVQSGWVGVVRDITVNMQMEERLEALSRRSIEMFEGERKRIARELHDDTIQELLFVTNQLQDVVDGIHGQLPKHIKERLNNLQALINHSTVELRGFIQRLRPAILDDMGLLSALRWLADKVANESKLHIQIRVMGKEVPLRPDIQLAIFRIAQEAFNNTKRYADASNIHLTIKYDGNKVAMSIKDNGKGFQTPVAPNFFTKQGKFGLAGMTERVALIGGNLSMESSIGKGTVIKVEIPNKSKL